MPLHRWLILLQNTCLIRLARQSYITKWTQVKRHILHSISLFLLSYSWHHLLQCERFHIKLLVQSLLNESLLLLLIEVLKIRVGGWSGSSWRFIIRIILHVLPRWWWQALWVSILAFQSEHTTNILSYDWKSDCSFLVRNEYILELTFTLIFTFES